MAKTNCPPSDKEGAEEHRQSRIATTVATTTATVAMTTAAAVGGGNSPQHRERLTWAKAARFLALPFAAARVDTFMRVKRFEEVSVDELVARGIEGILLDADGTLAPHHAREFDASVLNHVRAMLEKGLRVAIYTNAGEDRFQSFQKMGVKVARDLPAKPDPYGFRAAMTDFLQLRDPAKVCMIGDNYLTDGGAIDAGMHFIHVQPVRGDEPFLHSATRHFAYLCAEFYNRRAAQ